MRNALMLSGMVVALALIGATSPTSSQEKSPRSAAELMHALMWGTEPIGGPFTLVDHTGKTRTDADFRGKFLLIYFGFTFCPDICPTDLQVISSAIDQLGPAADLVQPLFITVDPDRDTPSHLSQYVSMFHPRLIGLTGNARQIRQAADAYKVYFAKVTDGAETTIDHSSFIYLLDQNGQYVGFFPPNTSAERLVLIVRNKITRSQANR